MTDKLEKILIVEDKKEYIADAKEILGDKIIGIVNTYKIFEEYLDKNSGNIHGVLSDLYFPSGYEGTPKHKFILGDEVACAIEDYLVTRNYYNNPIGNVVNEILKTGKLGNTHEDVVENLLKNENEISKLPGLKEVIELKLNKYHEFLEYKKLEKEKREGKRKFPMGMFVYKTCKEKNIPCIIVTDVYHHGTQFQPFVEKVGRYFDQLVDGKKQWEEAFEEIRKVMR